MASASGANEFRILSLSGGGYLGLYTAVLLERLEHKLGEPLGRRFDLIAGTSVGGLLALALAFEVPMAAIVALFRMRGEEVFSARRLPSGTVTRLLTDGRLILTLISVQQQHVQAIMEDRLGDRYLRLDAPWPPEAGLGIDVATPEATATLERLALETMASIAPRTLLKFF